MLQDAIRARVSSLDISQVFEELPLGRWALHQSADATVTVAVTPEAGGRAHLENDVGTAVDRVLVQVPVRIEPLPTGDKVTPSTVEDPA